MWIKQLFVVVLLTFFKQPEAFIPCCVPDDISTPCFTFNIIYRCSYFHLKQHKKSRWNWRMILLMVSWQPATNQKPATNSKVLEKLSNGNDLEIK